MNAFKVIVSYDGTGYYGWLSQPTKISIAAVLRKTFAKVFDVPFSLIGASKTDAGVHALGQVVLLKTTLQINAQRLMFAWNNTLPTAIVIRSVEPVPSSFHPRDKIQTKIYQYHFFLTRPLPFLNKYGWFFHNQVDLAKLQQCLEQFVGTHDFRSYCTGDEMKSTIRTIDSIRINYMTRFGCYRITVRGKSFLRHMIRRIVGAALFVASRPELSVDFLKQVMHNSNPNNMLPTAPAHGLLLRKIIYIGES